jgi:hypothetical protein
MFSKSSSSSDDGSVIGEEEIQFTMLPDERFREDGPINSTSLSDTLDEVNEGEF